VSENQREMPIFTRTFDFLEWLVPQTNHFPKIHRHTITRRLLDAVLDFQEELLEANGARSAARLQRLNRADTLLNKVRFYLRLVHHQRWLNAGQYEHASQMVAEIGRLLGGWQKATA